MIEKDIVQGQEAMRKDIDIIKTGVEVEVEAKVEIEDIGIKAEVGAEQEVEIESMKEGIKAIRKIRNIEAEKREENIMMKLIVVILKVMIQEKVERKKLKMNIEKA